MVKEDLNIVCTPLETMAVNHTFLFLRNQNLDIQGHLGMLFKGKVQESVRGELKLLRVLKQVPRCFVDFCLSIEEVSSIYLYQAFFFLFCHVNIFFF